jgi:hypothetical protein
MRDAAIKLRALPEQRDLIDRAKQFYEHYGFRSSPMHPMTLMLSLKQHP